MVEAAEQGKWIWSMPKTDVLEKRGVRVRQIKVLSRRKLCEDLWSTLNTALAQHQQESMGFKYGNFDLAARPAKCSWGELEAQLLEVGDQQQKILAGWPLFGKMSGALGIEGSCERGYRIRPRSRLVATVPPDAFSCWRGREKATSAPRHSGESMGENAYQKQYAPPPRRQAQTVLSPHQSTCRFLVSPRSLQCSACARQTRPSFKMTQPRAWQPTSKTDLPTMTTVKGQEQGGRVWTLAGNRVVCGNSTFRLVSSLTSWVLLLCCVSRSEVTSITFCKPCREKHKTVPSRLHQSKSQSFVIMKCRHQGRVQTDQVLMLSQTVGKAKRQNQRHNRDNKNRRRRQ